MTVPDEAVEAATEKLAELNSDAGDQLTDNEWALEILNAAAPFIAAQAWDEGIEAGVDEGVPECDYARNPYRSEQ